MRFALVFASVMMVSASALAQGAFAQIQVPASILSGVPFSVTVIINCPPPSEVPPPINCNGPTLASFQVSDPSATFPSGTIVLFPNQALSVPGSFVFYQPGAQTITLTSAQTGFIGAATFLVQAPAAPVPTLDVWPLLLLVMFIVFFAVAPNTSINRTLRRRASPAGSGRLSLR